MWTRGFGLRELGAQRSYLFRCRQPRLLHAYKVVLQGLLRALPSPYLIVSEVLSCGGEETQEFAGQAFLRWSVSSCGIALGLRKIRTGTRSLCPVPRGGTFLRRRRGVKNVWKPELKHGKPARDLRTGSQLRCHLQRSPDIVEPPWTPVHPTRAFTLAAGSSRFSARFVKVAHRLRRKPVERDRVGCTPLGHRFPVGKRRPPAC
ncbi:hypothetical protein AAFF_G00058680 [Aldrovandia affinis]|uniref:Uncharacterized protein n=1 Tax=Aldrovandia affinis TaxID=143900 RepID=A0AAD7S0E6_9TELE|nr:hypothetical protein AAFF_G00058680 [Aldrovandia affinis]